MREFVKCSFGLMKANRLRLQATSLCIFVFLFAPTVTAQNSQQDKRAKADKVLDEAFALFEQGTAESLRTAFTKFNEAREIAHSIDYKEAEAASLLGMGRISYDLGKKQKALDYYTQALPLWKIAGEKQGEFTTLNLIGKTYNSLGERQKAIDYYIQALPLVRAVKDKQGEAAIFNNIGLVYSSLGEKQKALEYFNQALSLERIVGDKSGEAYILNNFGLVYYALGEKQKALDYYNQALTLIKIAEDKSLEAITLNNIGMVYYSLGEKQRALDYYNQTLLLIKIVMDKSLEASTLNNIGLAYFSLGDRQKALNYFNQALPLERAIGDKSTEAKTLGNMMVVWNSIKNPRLTIFYGKQSVNLFQELRANIKGLDKEIQRTYLKSIVSTYRYLAEILISSGRLLEAEQVLGLLKDEEFSTLRRRSDDAAEIGYTPTEKAALDVLNKLAEYGRELVDLYALKEKKALDEKGKERIANIEDKLIPIANAEYLKALDEISKAPKTEEKTAEVKEAQALQKSVGELGDGTVALYTVVSTEDCKSTKGWVILVTPKFRKAYTIDVKDLEKTVFAFRHALSSPVYDPAPLAQKLYRAIFQNPQTDGKTLAEDLDTYLKDKKEKTLMWSLDGILRYVPIAALHNGKNYLVENYRNVVFTTASINVGLTKSASKDWDALGMGVSKEYSPFKGLKGVPLEITAIIRDNKNTKGILPGVAMLDDKFTEKTMLDGLREGYKVVHFATHFSYKVEKPEDSFLLLGDGNRWELKKIETLSQIFENAELVTLSACDTGVGDVCQKANGKDVEGFAYYAQRLGAQAVIASLWHVDDIGTQVLMPEFYRLRQTGMNKAESMRQTQLALLNGKLNKENTSLARSEPLNQEKNELNLTRHKEDPKKPFAHPYYWAPFILIGNWK